MNTPPIAIDGPAASGKSTIARMVAERLGGICVSTGDMYRALTWEALRRDIDPEKKPEEVAAMLPSCTLSVRPTGGVGSIPELNGEPVSDDVLHTPAIASQVSYVARIPQVRSWLVERQRETVALGLVVMEGRDIGTVIFPDTPHKFFLTATPEVRARRRLAQGGDTLDSDTVEAVAARIAERDRIDSTRAVSPLRPAEDARVIDSSDLAPEEVTDIVVRAVAEHASGRDT